MQWRSFDLQVRFGFCLATTTWNRRRSPWRLSWPMASLCRGTVALRRWSPYRPHGPVAGALTMRLGAVLCCPGLTDRGGSSRTMPRSRTTLTWRTRLGAVARASLSCGRTRSPMRPGRGAGMTWRFSGPWRPKMWMVPGLCFRTLVRTCFATHLRLCGAGALLCGAHVLGRTLAAKLAVLRSLWSWWPFGGWLGVFVNWLGNLGMAVFGIKLHDNLVILRPLVSGCLKFLSSGWSFGQTLWRSTSTRWRLSRKRLR
mmetsp:Transcript_43311/g.103219  ORF Transcript_43311/g.103219 Transcript_43311/m.103219 type:complete len:256 (+) Transcript_43311:1649-2416(+)